MTPLVWIAMPGNEPMAERLSALTGGEIAALETRRFPDGETYLRLTGGVSRRQVAIVCTLDHPDGKFLPLAFAAATARELGASRVGLVAPYLAYMRQDRRFKDGEAVTATQFARLLSGSVDWLVKRIAAHVRCPFVVLANAGSATGKSPSICPTCRPCADESLCRWTTSFHRPAR